MHRDARELQDGSLIQGDICIIGSGAAGISMALEWVGRGEKVILLEAGGFELEPEVQASNAGENVGQTYYALEATRLRYFGGTTGHWYGFCAPFDAIDFEQRNWVPHSGWPFGKETLDPYYARAHNVVELGPYEYEPAYWEQQDGAYKRIPLDENIVRTKIWQFSPPTRFNTKYRDALVEAPNVHLYTHASVCDLRCNENVNRVREAVVKTHAVAGAEGKSLRVKARRFILACGALQNARLLLASNNQASKGLGNDRDQVGRYFMEHPEIRTALLYMNGDVPLDLYHFDWFRTKVRGEIGVSEALQREYGLLNCTASFWPGRSKNALPAIKAFPDNAAETLRNRDNRKKAFEEGRLKSVYSGSRGEYLLSTRLEQAPNPDSRVMLGDKKDALGVPLVKLDWRLSDLDRYSIRKSYELIGQELGRSGIGRIQLADWASREDGGWSDELGGGWHHMGTTRMHTDPARGVVDANGKVHGINNLYVAGSSAFTTAGVSNPTLTVIAMSLRLADHLKSLT